MLFVHDHIFVRNSGCVYSTGTLDSYFWEKYKQLFDDPNIHVIARGIESDHFKLSKKVQDIGFTLMSTKRVDIRAIVERVKNSDYLVVRMPSVLGVIAYAAGKKYHKLMLIELVTDPRVSFWYHGDILHKLLMPIAVLAQKKIVYDAPYVHYVSKEYLQRHYPTKGVSLSCPDILLQRVEDSVLQRRIFYRKSGFNGTLILGLIGGYNLTYRGHVTLFKAAKLLLSKGFNITIRLLGGGTADHLKAEAEKIGISEHIVFDGYYAERERVNEWIDQIDILVMPTKAETLGRAAIEAMSRGCPVVGSSDTALREHLPGECLCRSGDYRTIAKIVNGLAEDVNLYQRLCEDSFNRAKEYYEDRLLPIRESFYRGFRGADKSNEQ